MKNKAVSLLLGFVLTLTMSVCADAETAEADGNATVQQAAVSVAYNTQTGMYIHSFVDGCCFHASEELHGGDITTSALWLATESEDIEIRVTLDGVPFAYSPATVLDTEGEYTIQIYHRHGGNESVTYIVRIVPPEDIAQEQPESIQGRLELVPDGSGFSYSFGGTDSIYSNVLDGETISFPAKLTLSDGLYCTVIKDGEVYSLPQNGVISESGSYSMELTSYAVDSSVETRRFGFNICIGETNRLGVYHPPFGYSIVSVTLDDKEQPHGGDMYRFTGDGEYVIAYSNGDSERSVTLVRDTAAPVLYFNGGSGMVFDEVVVVTTDSPCTVTVEKNGMPIDGTTLKGTGIYRVTAVDEAGNTASSRIEIQAVSAFNPMNFALIFGMAAIAAVVYFILIKCSKPVVR